MIHDNRAVKFLDAIAPTRDYGVPFKDWFRYGPNNSLTFIEVDGSYFIVSMNNIDSMRVYRQKPDEPDSTILEITWADGDVLLVTLGDDPTLASAAELLLLPSNCCPPPPDECLLVDITPLDFVFDIAVPALMSIPIPPAPKKGSWYVTFDFRTRYTNPVNPFAVGQGFGQSVRIFGSSVPTMNTQGFDQRVNTTNTLDPDPLAMDSAGHYSRTIAVNQNDAPTVIFNVLQLGSLPAGINTAEVFIENIVAVFNPCDFK